MSRQRFTRGLAAVLLFALIASGWVFYQEVVRTFSADPTVWEPEMTEFEREDRESPPPENAILFVGSSSIRFWEELPSDMAPMAVIRRGFGGAKLTDLIHFADRIILPYSPRAIVIHAGGNELTESPGNARRTPSEALADYRELIALIRTRHRNIPIYYLALRPSRLPGARDELMALIQTETASTTGLEYIEAGAGLMLPSGAPNPELIRWDFIHLNRQGYEAWAPVVRDRLLRDLGPGTTAPG